MRTNLAFLLGGLCALAPTALLAAVISLDTELTAVAEFDNETLARPVIDSDAAAGPRTSFLEVDSLVTGLRPFEFLPNGLGGFVSATGDSTGLFGVGVNGFFAQAARSRPNSMLASGTHTRAEFNDTDEVVTFSLTGFIPAPVITIDSRIAGSNLGGFDPTLDVSAQVLARIVTTVTRLDGSTDEEVVLEYGMQTGRDALGKFHVTSTAGAPAPTAANEFFRTSFSLPDHGFTLASFVAAAPGEILTVDFQYFATGSTGVPETGIFAAMGDPFDLTSAGGRIDLTQAGVVEPPLAPVPLPGAFASLAVGLGALSFARRRRS
jgi:hypothetical protein